MKKNLLKIKEILAKAYENSKIVKFVESDEGGFLSANTMKGKDSLEVSVFGNEDRIILVSRFDNLGKGASGAAIECMNILMGIDPKTGLSL